MEDIIEPTPFNASEHIFDVAFHPTNNVLACTLITGETKLISYDLNNTKELASLKFNKKSCRTCQFAPTGKFLVTGYEDGSLCFVDENGNLVHKVKGAHEFPIYSLYFLEEDVLATGDDEGVIKIWDLNNFNCVWEVSEQEGTITDMVCDESKKFLLSTSTDGTLGVYDLTKGKNSKEKLYALSDSMEEDLLAISLVKNGRKVLCSSQEGCIYVFNWDWFGDCKDRILGHPNSIDTMLKIDENTVITGSEDGYIRGVSVGPNKVLNYLGNHSDGDEVEPVCRMSLSSDKKFVATISHDNWIKFHNISSFVEGRKIAEVDKDDDDDDDDEKEGDDEKWDDSDVEDFEDRKKMPKKPKIQDRKKEIELEKKKNFFSDL